MAQKMLSGKSMKNVLKTTLAVILTILCQISFAGNSSEKDSPAIQLLESGPKARKLEGAMLRMARVVMKKTPMVVIMNDIDLIIICPMENASKDFSQKVTSMLKNYALAGEVNEKDSEMSVYIDAVKNGHFTELIIYNKRPDDSIMLFQGNFTPEELQEMGSRFEAQHAPRSKEQ